jgi:hypothetical protein
VVDAVAVEVGTPPTHRPIASAAVCIPALDECLTTEGQGQTAFTGVPPGTYSISVSANGYYPLDLTMGVEDGVTSQLHAALSRPLLRGQMRVVLTWGSALQGLDAHLWLPATRAYHVYGADPGKCSEWPGACLNMEDTAPFSSETISIDQRTAGRYVYAVRDPAPAGQISQTQAVVRVYKNLDGVNGLAHEIVVPAGGAGSWWHVFDLDGATGAITIHNEILTESPAPY